MSKILYAGPPLLEFGWELMCWQARLRRISKKYDRTYVHCRPGTEALYSDFAVVNEIPPVQSDRWESPEVKVIPANTCLINYKRNMTSKHMKQAGFYDQDFIKFGTPPKDYCPDVLIHARARKLRGKDNWGEDRYKKLIKMIKRAGYTVAVIGIQGQANHCGLSSKENIMDIPLKHLMNYMAGAKCVVGTSSGPMHLAALCGCPHVVITYSGNRDRYYTHWNPFKTPVRIPKGGWHPSEEEVLDSTLRLLKGKPEIIYKDPPLPRKSKKAKKAKLEHATTTNPKKRKAIHIPPLDRPGKDHRSKLTRFAKVHKGKPFKVVFVGSGMSVLDAPLGQKIDSMDIVVRFNKFKLGKKNMKYAGVRTDVVAFNSSRATLTHVLKMRDMSPYFLFCTPFSEVRNRATMNRLSKHFRTRKADFDFVRDKTKRRMEAEVGLSKKRMTTAMASIAYFLERFPQAELYLHGFDYLAHKKPKMRHYWDGGKTTLKSAHDPAREAVYLRKLIKEGKAKLLT